MRISNVCGQLHRRIIKLGDHGISLEGGLKLELKREGTGTMVSRDLDQDETHRSQREKARRETMKVGNSTVVEEI